MKHYGDITKLRGSELPVVDVITGGSPCQDLSIAGKRAGLDGERSGLFMDQIRIIKEMREHDRTTGRANEFIRPRYMVWENVPGAFSSGSPKGADFQAVLTEIARIADPKVPDVPLPQGGWPHSGLIYDEMGRWSIAWRLHDAQHWGVPQRRKRIALVGDFGGLSAGEVCFERKGMCWNPAESGETREDSSETTPSGVGSSSEERIIGFNRERQGASFIQDAMPTLQAAAGESGNNKPMVCIPAKPIVGCNIGGQAKIFQPSDQACTLRAETTGVVLPEGKAISFQERAGKPGGGKGILIQDEHVGALSTVNNQSVLAYGISSFDSNAMKSSNPASGIYEAETARTLDLNGGNPACNQGGIAIVEGAAHRPKASNIFGDEIAPTLVSSMSTPVGNTQDGFNVVAMDVGWLQVADEQCPSLLARQYKDPPIMCSDKAGSLMASGYSKLGTQEAANNMYVVTAVDCRSASENPDVNGTLQAKESGEFSVNYQNTVRVGAMVRRLTPLECERLQGFPDGWTDIGDWVDTKGKKHKASDSARYKALGNSIAVGYANGASGFWCWLLKRISAQYERNATLGSLFDGIGGFPLAWEHYNGKGSALWASEIEEFCIAVTKKRFPEEGDPDVNTD